MVQAEPLLDTRAAAAATVTPVAGIGLPERPLLVSSVQLAGELQGTGFREQQWLIERGDQFIQVTEVLYRVVEQINGERTLAEIADAVTAATDWLVTAENVRQLIERHLVPPGLIATASVATAVPDGTTARAPTVSPLAVNLRMKVIAPQTIEPVARTLQVLFAPWVLLPVLIAVAVGHGWLYLEHGVAQSIIQVLYTPWLALPVLALTLLAGVVHEFGHAAALRYGGGRARGMGVGLYLIFPAFYTDTTASYRLGRWARVRTSLGGFYFHLIFALGMIGLYLLSRQEFLLLVVLLINADIVRQSLPFVRFDGYWALADLTGIPDFFSQMGAFVRSVVPIPGWRGSKLPTLKAWVKAVFAVYMLATVPVLVFLLYTLVTGLPHLMLTAADSVRRQTAALSLAQQRGDVLLLAALAAQLLIILLQLVAPPYLLAVWARRAVRAGWQWSRVSPARRMAGALAGAAAIALLLVLWWPQLARAF